MTGKAPSTLIASSGDSLARFSRPSKRSHAVEGAGRSPDEKDQRARFGLGARPDDRCDAQVDPSAVEGLQAFVDGLAGAFAAVAWFGSSPTSEALYAASK